MNPFENLHILGNCLLTETSPEFHPRQRDAQKESPTTSEPQQNNSPPPSQPSSDVTTDVESSSEVQIVPLADSGLPYEDVELLKKLCHLPQLTRPHVGRIMPKTYARPPIYDITKYLVYDDEFAYKPKKYDMQRCRRRAFQRPLKIYTGGSLVSEPIDERVLVQKTGDTCRLRSMRRKVYGYPKNLHDLCRRVSILEKRLGTSEIGMHWKCLRRASKKKRM